MPQRGATSSTGRCTTWRTRRRTPSTPPGWNARSRASASSAAPEQAAARLRGRRRGREQTHGAVAAHLGARAEAAPLEAVARRREQITVLVVHRQADDVDLHALHRDACEL